MSLWKEKTDPDLGEHKVNHGFRGMSRPSYSRYRRWKQNTNFLHCHVHNSNSSDLNEEEPYWFAFVW